MTGVWVGIDVSKAWLDVHLAGAKGGLRVPNDAAGHGELMASLGGVPVAGVVLEAIDRRAVDPSPQEPGPEARAAATSGRCRRS